MEEKKGEVVLFKTWANAFCTKVELALKLKGIPYEYVEEDLTNKSELFLSLNPVHFSLLFSIFLFLPSLPEVLTEVLK